MELKISKNYRMDKEENRCRNYFVFYHLCLREPDLQKLGYGIAYDRQRQIFAIRDLLPIDKTQVISDSLSVNDFLIYF